MSEFEPDVFAPFSRFPDANEDAALALFSMIGGIEGMVAKGIRLTDFAPIFSADPDDDLSGLRLIAERMTFGSEESAFVRYDDSEEPLMSPEMAKWWLISSQRAKEIDGQLVLRDDIDHVGSAGLIIAQGEDSQLLSQIYLETKQSRDGLTEGVVVAGIAKFAVDEFTRTFEINSDHL